MILEHLALEAQIHEQTWHAMLRAATAGRGAKRALARQVGKTPEFLSNVVGRSRARDFSLATARQIAAVLPWDAETRASFIEHVTLAKERTLLHVEAFQHACGDRLLREFLPELGVAFHQAANGDDPLLARQQYQAVRDRCKELLRAFDPRRGSLEYVDVCLMLCNVQCVLDRPDEALFYGKIACTLLDELHPPARPEAREHFDEVHVGAYRAAALAYHNLGLERKSYQTNLGTEYILHQAWMQPVVGTIHLYVNLIRALSQTPRFSIREIEYLAGQAEKACELVADAPTYQVQQFVIQRALGAAYTTYGNLERAKAVLVPLLDHYTTLPELGIVPQAGFLTTYAVYAQQIGDQDAWESRTREALRLALDAGLTHQIRLNKEAFGAAVIEPMLLQVGSERAR